MRIRNVLTVGYEGRKPDGFLVAMRHWRVEVLVDVRDRASSRKQGFSKSALQAMLEQAGIQYVHFRLLGVPAELRKHLRDGQVDWQEYLESYREHLGNHDGVVTELVELAERRTCCLLCVEHEPSQCHRSVLAESVCKRSALGLAIQDI